MTLEYTLRYKQAAAVWIHILKNYNHIPVRWGLLSYFFRNNVRRHYLVVVEERKTTRAPDNRSVRECCRDDNTRNM